MIREDQNHHRATAPESTDNTRPMHLPIILQSEHLRRHIDDASLVLVDLSKPESYLESHIPGARQFDYNALVNGQPPAPGLPADLIQIEKKIQQLGLNQGQTVVAL